MMVVGGENAHLAIGRREECSWDIFHELAWVCLRVSILYCVPM